MNFLAHAKPPTSATANTAHAVSLTGDADDEIGNASCECVGEDSFPDLGANPRYMALAAKIERGDRLNNFERAERQGLVFNHGGKPSGFSVI